MPFSNRTAALCVALFAACALLTFGGILKNAFVTLDDNYLIYENPVITRITPGTIKHVFTTFDPELYDPLTFITYQIDYQIGGLNPAVYHAQNLAWHTINALLVAWVLWELFGNVAIAILLGLLYLAHPLNTEAVAWAAARKDVLSTFFFLSSLLAYIRYRATSVTRTYWVSVGLFFLGLLSKVSVVTLPIALLLIDWREGRRIDRDSMQEKVAYVIPAVVFGIIALFGKTNALAVTTLAQKILMAFMTTWFTFLSFLVPTKLSILYPFTGAVSLASPHILTAIVAVCILVTLALVSLRRTREIAFGLGFFLVTLAPVFVNFAKGNEIYMGSDRYGYIPMIGLLSIIAYVLVQTAQRGRTWMFAGNVVMGILAVVGAVAASVQAATWRDSETLFSNVLVNYPNSLTARNNLGMAYLAQGKSDKALAEFNALLEKKEWPITLVNRGLTKFRQGDNAGAIADYTRAMELDPMFYDSYYELGNIAYRSGNLTSAIDLYKKAHALKPQYTNALNNLGAAQIQMQQWNEAAQTFRDLIALNPLFVEAYYNLAVIDEQTGNKQEAIGMYTQALRLNPNDADATKGLARARLMR
ncbi:tetratricopeptide repeat protein [Candidatus Peribacteria bacterium]|nr:tetratricopeptide repeat protein [Candidatus Peribacteria bacterium]